MIPGDGAVQGCELDFDDPMGDFQLKISHEYFVRELLCTMQCSKSLQMLEKKESMSAKDPLKLFFHVNRIHSDVRAERKNLVLIEAICNT